MTETNDPSVVDRYRRLISTFRSGGCDAEQFVREFLVEWKRDRDSGVRTGDTIDNLMTSVDCYEPTPVEAWEIDEQQLRADAAAADEDLGRT